MIPSNDKRKLAADNHGLERAPLIGDRFLTQKLINLRGFA